MLPTQHPLCDGAPIGAADNQVLQLAVRSCPRGCMVLQTRTLFLKSSVSLTPHAGIFSTANAGIVASQKSSAV